ncbi:MAG TPA: acyloxyacyl hydrolase [Terracidiphilus sp.]|nr:acyloxyacyl hydrolase [Terracidiphilus sp.]
MLKTGVLLFVATSLLFFHPLAAQSTASAPYQIFAGVTRLSNSFDGLPGSRHPLDGWDASAALRSWHGLRFKVAVSKFNGSNLGAAQNAIFIMGGGQYEHYFHGEGLFGQAMFGDGGLDRNWAPNGGPGNTASFSTLLGGGLDTPLGHHLAIRVEGDFQWANFALVEPKPLNAPYEIPGLPNYFARITTGLLWMPRLGRPVDNSARWGTFPHRSPESRLVFEGMSSFGHYHIFAYTWWSYLHVGGIEYDRNSWGTFIGAQMNYVAEILPAVFLTQPRTTDAFGDVRGPGKRTIEGLEISPAGLQMLWNAHGAVKPYYMIKGGMIAFTHKALSNYASYMDFTLQQNVGAQFRLSPRWDLRTSIGDFHFSNAFMVPNNPGIDEMTWGGGLSYRLNQRRE